jgi:predicted metalloprotease with PDZ domain
VLRAWIGERLWIGPDDAAHEAEAYWFSEGVTRHLARDLLFRFGLLTSRELLDEVHGLAAVAATSARRGESNKELAAHAKEAGAVPLLVARGALYAAGVEARIRAKSKGKRHLEDVLRTLLQKAREARSALPASAWIEALRGELGAGEDAVFAQAIGEGRIADLPDEALGPCFRRGPRTYEAYDLGFDEDATRAAADAKIVGLRAGGPAEKAGLRAGDVLVDAVIGRGRSDVVVSITVQRGSEKKTVKYLPAGAKAKGVGFVRKSDVPEESCAR